MRTKLVDPRKFSLPPPIEHFVEMNDKKKIHTWLFTREDGKSKKTVVFLHGNAGNISFRVETFKGLFHKCDMNVLAVEYRGFGMSEGVPAQHKINSDVKFILKWASAELNEKIDGENLILFGRSLGGAAAIHGLDEHHVPNVKAIILENTFTNVGDVLDHVMPYLRVFKPLVSDPWNSERIVKNLKIPALFLSSSKDELIPPALMKRLFESYGGEAFEEKNMVVFEGCGHMNAYTMSKYFPAINEFVSQLSHRPVFPGLGLSLEEHE